MAGYHPVSCNSFIIVFTDTTHYFFKPGASEKEINPYWKDGGTGLPQEERSVVKPAVKVTGVGDSGLTWLRKSYQRCVEQAREEGRSLEDLAAERWGVSLAVRTEFISVLFKLSK